MSKLRRLSLLAMLLLLGFGAPVMLTVNADPSPAAAMARRSLPEAEWCCLAGLSCCVDPPRPPAR
jgi:hypothetical protein